MTGPEGMKIVPQEVEDSTPQTFMESVERKWSEGKFVCVGLDSQYDKIPEFLKEGKSREDAIFEFNKAIIDATQDLTAVYKPNAAFYEAEGEEGVNALRRTISYIKDTTDVPVILDAKRGDIGNTNDGYVKAAFDEMRADAITVHGYLGKEAMQPFLKRRDKGVFVLARTSNPGAGEFQDLMVDGKPLYQIVAENVTSSWNENGNVGLVMGATSSEELRRIREVLSEVPLLIPGVGAQGGTAEEVVPVAKERFLVNSSRGIIFASNGEDFAESARRETLKLHEQIGNSMS